MPIRPAIVIDATSVEGQAEQAQFLQQLRDYRNAQNATESNLVTDRKPGFLRRLVLPNTVTVHC